MVKLLKARVPTMDHRRVPPPPKTADNFYHSREWRDLISYLIKTRGRQCEDPRHDSSRPAGRLYGDHIVELRDGGAPLDPSNIMLRCARCHGRKTAEERAKRAGIAR